MGMIYNLRQTPSATLDYLLKYPGSITGFLYPDLPPQMSHPGFLRRLFGARPAAVDSVEMPAVDLIGGDDIDLDKAWHGLHFLFTGTAWEGNQPESFLLNWGTEIGDIDVGYGPARGFTIAETARIAKFLSSTDSTTLADRYDPQRMSDLKIYPSIWDRDEGLDYLLEYFPILNKFIQDTCQKQLGIVVYLN
jgi:hypothetical protein